MSVTMMSEVWKMDLPSNEILVLLAFADHANDDGCMWPSYDRIVWKTGYSKDSVKRIVRSLTDKNILVKLGGGTGRGYANVFKINVMAAPMKEQFKTDKGGDIAIPSDNNKGGDIANKGGDIATKGEAICPPQPLEPSKNHNDKKVSKKNGVPVAVSVFRKAASRYPPKSWYEKINKAIGENEDDLRLWESIVSNYVGSGWNPGNVRNMLEFYSRREIPGMGKGAAVKIDENGRKVVAV